MNGLGKEHELRSLYARVIDLEREHGDARDQVRALTLLHAILSKIAIERDRETIVRLILEAAHQPLGFSRAAFLEVDTTATRVAFVSTSRDGFATCDDPVDASADGAVDRLFRFGDEHYVGRAGELGTPFVDTRGWFALTALRRGSTILGLLYVDEHRSPQPREWEVGLVRALATIASVAIENANLIARLEALATRDPLTGLLNRRAFAERLAHSIDAAKRGSRSLAFAIVDVDDFKAINDTRGHAHGDSVLKHLAGVLQRECRAHDIVARFAGDEFVVLLIDIEPTLARAMIRRLSATLSSSGLKCSIGVAIYPADAAGAAELLESSDRALYAAKAAGKNTFAFCNANPADTERGAFARAPR